MSAEAQNNIALLIDSVSPDYEVIKFFSERLNKEKLTLAVIKEATTQFDIIFVCQPATNSLFKALKQFTKYVVFLYPSIDQVKHDSVAYALADSITDYLLVYSQNSDIIRYIQELMLYPKTLTKFTDYLHFIIYIVKNFLFTEYLQAIDASNLTSPKLQQPMSIAKQYALDVICAVIEEKSAMQVLFHALRADLKTEKCYVL